MAAILVISALFVVLIGVGFWISHKVQAIEDNSGYTEWKANHLLR